MFKFQRVLSHCETERSLVQHAPGLRQSTKLKAFQVFAAIGELEHNKELVARELVWKEHVNDQTWKMQSAAYGITYDEAFILV